jgi:hypothetical protein
VQRLVDVDEVIALSLQLGGIPRVEDHTILHPGPGKVSLGGGDRGLVGVDAVHASLRICASDRDRREALAAGDVGNASGWIGFEADMHVGDCGQPLFAELGLEHRPRELRLALMEVGAVRRVRDALSGPKRLEQRVERLHASGDKLCDRRDEVEAGLVEQRLVMPGRERISPPSRLR